MHLNEGRYLDWKKQIDQISPFLETTKSGTIQLLAATKAAPNVFLDIIRDFCDNKKIFNYHINPSDDENTTILATLLDRLEEKLEIGQTGQPINGTPSPMNISLGNDIQAGGNVTVAHSIFHLTPMDPSKGRHHRNKQIRDAIQSRLNAQGKVLFIWTESSDTAPITKQWFWRDLWENNLLDFLNKGLVIIVHSDQYGRQAKWPPVSG